MKNQQISFTPIGYVESEYTGQVPSYEAREWVSKVKILEKYIEGLHGIERFSHIIILFVFHKVNKNDVTLRVHPRKDPILPLVGVFASRAQVRPNPIGLCVAKLIEKEHTTLKVKGLDAFNGSPVIDIKPYLPRLDSYPDAKVPPYL
ncbi:MAG: tRNA (N6-threonylcarbamoyladenosine(37)-N6)-methyltransferase TrmO [Candidatus Odinarchaeia archaeon]